HGREEIAAGVDLSRTVGWFTSAYPVAVDPGELPTAEVFAGGPAAGTALKRVKEQLRAIPDGGLGYGLLRYLHPQTAQVLARHPEPQIGFNYLGRLGTADGEETGVSDPAALADGGMPLPHAVAVNATAVTYPDGPRLVAHWTWAGELFTEAQVRDLAEAWFRAIEALVAHADRAAGGGGLSPSDVPLA